MGFTDTSRQGVEPKKKEAAPPVWGFNRSPKKIERCQSKMLHCINIQKHTFPLHKYTMSSVDFGTKFGCCAMIPRSEKVSKIRFFDARETPPQCPLDAIMMLTFFDAVVIAIATCSYRDSNMMLSTCVHVVIKLATCTQVEGTSF